MARRRGLGRLEAEPCHSSSVSVPGQRDAVLMIEMVAKSWAACLRHPSPSTDQLCFELSCSQIPFPSASSFPIRAPLTAWAWRRRHGAGGKCSTVLWAVAVTRTSSRKPRCVAPFCFQPIIIQPGGAPPVPPKLSDSGLGRKGICKGYIKKR